MATENTPTKPKIIILHETVWQSWLRDASTFALFLGLIGIGVLLQSVALQWVGAIIAFISIGARPLSKRLSFDAARKYIDELEAAHA